MPFMLSPGVAVTEKNLTTVVPAVSSSVGAFAGPFSWGPVSDPLLVSSEVEMASRFGIPNDAIAQHWFVPANFLSYSGAMYINRVDTTLQRNAVSVQTGSVSIALNSGGSGYAPSILNNPVTISAPDIAGGIQATATAATDGTGAIISVTVTNPGSGYTDAPTVTFGGTGASATATATVAVGGIKLNNAEQYQTSFENGAGVVGQWAAKYPGTLGNSIRVSMADSASFAAWAYKDQFSSAPTGDQLHVILIDVDGKITGTTGLVLEKYEYVSKASDAKKADGTQNYYKSVINSKSKWIWWMDHPDASNWGGITGTVFTTLATALTQTLSGGVDDYNMTDGQQQNGYAIYSNVDLYDISLIPAGKATATTATYLINNIAEVRKDCVAFVSPQDTTTGDVLIGSSSELAEEMIAYRNLLPSSSYFMIDSGYKYQYDRYNDKYRWVPLNGDIAGLCARLDFTDDPWFSPGGFNRGQIKNVVRLAFNPSSVAVRDLLYKSNVNPVVSFPGQGTVLYGDKTGLAQPSAFDRINVRRLFITLEKSISTAAKYSLFELNTAFTRSAFKSMVEPFLRTVQGRSGITDFKVVCDETNNTGDVIDRNEFVGDIYIKPSRSINFISLNFIAVATGVSFSEVGA